ncbi:hypothetical protein [uncultured Jannaschia sp.]|uniref:hypothetical protein n=1 Tax=uncultured Jannaschia sp. TaxID=293347 RepID=UPI002609C3E1|nr:hypothetical protein [uncultured Jannaschia sp.]
MFLLSASVSLSFIWAFWAWTHRAHPGPDPASYTRIETLSMQLMVALLIAGTIGFGSTCAILLAPAQTFGALSPAMAPTILAATALAWIVAVRVRRVRGPSVLPRLGTAVTTC